ncbi:RNA polymerase sigma factor ShbA [Micromonospora sp. NPDC048930]|uniref:RNA polymerase sigma factor ShbA n=1 Tax=Micromonospora sp. NPDC048930 TaxID=3364261 RepID=UPI00371E9700
MIRAVDPELVRQAVHGDRAATAALLTDVRPGLVRYCRARLGRVSGAYTTADDVAQEVCLAVLRSLHRYQEQGIPFAAFVYGIAAHKVADAHRAAVRDAAVTPTDVPLEQPDAAPGPEQQAVSTDLARRLSALLDRLPDVQREIILLRVAVGLSADEVGTIVGMTAAAVRMAQSRALTRLRTLAEGSLDEVAA